LKPRIPCGSLPVPSIQSLSLRCPTRRPGNMPPEPHSPRVW
jgi:hypothetical protein